MDPVFLIIRTLGQLFVFICLLRFLMQAMRVDYYNPISQAVVKFTQIPLAPLQPLRLKLGRTDLSPLLLGYLINLAVLFLLVSLSSASAGLTTLLVLSLVGILDMLLTILFWATIASVVISWVAPGSHHPGPQLILQLTEPMFALVRRVIPPIGGLDLSPIAIFLVIQIIQSQLPRMM